MTPDTTPRVFYRFEYNGRWWISNGYWMVEHTAPQDVGDDKIQRLIEALSDDNPTATLTPVTLNDRPGGHQVTIDLAGANCLVFRRESDGEQVFVNRDVWEDAGAPRLLDPPVQIGNKLGVVRFSGGGRTVYVMPTRMVGVG